MLKAFRYLYLNPRIQNVPQIEPGLVWQTVREVSEKSDPIRNTGYEPGLRMCVT